MDGFAIKSKFSVRVGVALQTSVELIRASVKFDKDGFHPMTGFTFKAREYTPGEERLLDAALRYLLAYFQLPVPRVVTNRLDADRLAARLSAASVWTSFCVAATQEYAADTGDMPFDADVPPRPEVLVLSDLALDVQEAAMATLVAGFAVEVPEELMLTVAGDADAVTGVYAGE